MRALTIHAGARALAHLRSHGLRPTDVRVVPAAAGGPKGLVLNALDRHLFGRWLPQGGHDVHLLGASIGAWRMAAACLADPARAFDALADGYIGQQYEHAPGKPPKPAHVSERFAQTLTGFFGGREDEVLCHPRWHLHVFTSRGRHLLHREGRPLSKVSTPLGYLGAFATNAVARKAMGGWLERVVIGDARVPLPLHLSDYRTQQVALARENLAPAILASCSIPFWLDAVRDIPGAPPGAYWDGGITDYHLHLDYASMAEGLVLYPHFQRTLVPGWLDKALRHRHRATERLSNVIVLAPSAPWVASLPHGKLPDRSDFKRYGDDLDARRRDWGRAVGEGERLAEEFAAWVEGRLDLPVLPLT